MVAAFLPSATLQVIAADQAWCELVGGTETSLREAEAATTATD